MANTSIERSPNLTIEVVDWRKRKSDDDLFREVKRPRQWYFRLESESSVPSEEDTESVYSIQDKETDIARDTSDTDTKSESDSSDAVDFEVEYDVASMSENEGYHIVDHSSSGTEDIMLEDAIAAAICETSLEAWATDNETSDNSSIEEIEYGRLEFGKCVQCKSPNDNPRYRYCEKCYQVRKMMFPPRPRGRSRKRAIKVQKQGRVKADALSCLSGLSQDSGLNSSQELVKVDTLRSCLSGLSQDSGLGSSQELQSLDFEQIVVPDHLKSSSPLVKFDENIDQNKSPISKSDIEVQIIEASSSSSKPSTKTSVSDAEILYSIETKSIANEEVTVVNNLKRKRIENASTTDKEASDLKKVKFEQQNKDNIKQENDNEKSKASNQIEEKQTQGEGANTFPECKELCIMCNMFPKNSIFLHGSIAHMCCCYKCAVKTWRTSKRCPICNCRVRNVVKVFMT